MKIKNLGLKISLIVSLMTAIMIVLVVFIVTLRTDALVSRLTTTEARSANATFAEHIHNLQNDTYMRAQMIADSPDIVNSILNGNEAELKKDLVNMGIGFDVVTLCDAEGTVLARMHNDTKGDNVLSQTALSVALNTGTGMSTIEKGSVVGLSTRGSAAIRDHDGNIIAAVTCGHDLSQMKYVDEFKESSGCEVTLFDGDTRLSTTLVDDSGERVIGTKAGDAVIEQVINQRMDFESQIPLFGNEYSVYYSPLIIDDQVIGMLFAGVNIDDTLAEKQSTINMVLTTTVTAGVVSVTVVFIVCIFMISRPLKKIGAFANKIRIGELGLTSASQSTISVRSSDEVGVLARSLEQAYAQLKGYVGEIKDKTENIAGGNLTIESTYEFHGDFNLIGTSINNIIANLNNTITDIYSSTAQVSTGSKQIADGAQALAQGSTQQAASVQELSASISDIAHKTKDNADKAGKAAALANTIKSNAEKGSRQMGEMTAAVKDINTASQNIKKVIKVIDDIAFQTNILALNAAVEAARAGQHGKGFAVVAEEVRSLASKSADAARETGEMIENSMEKAELGSRIADETASSLAEIVSGINESSQIVSEIAKSSEEQSAGIEQINHGIDQVANVVQQNSATAEQSAAASEEMSGQSHILEDLLSQFKLKGQGNFALGAGHKQLAMPEKTSPDNE
ncbi:MAG: methyl-accepting chemotaxis protein [Oscillospiraceae bacterium]|nr:methyl-accepting chemotaxis protein [Oscillospiraceae bacterium]